MAHAGQGRQARERDRRNPERAESGSDESVGLCSVCRHATRQRSARGSMFWRCRAADRDERLLRYPPLPVRRCPAFERKGGSDQRSTRRV